MDVNPMMTPGQPAPPPQMAAPPPPVPPPSPTAPAVPVKIPLDAEGLNSLDAWKDRVQSSEDLIDKVKTDWERNQARYLVKPDAAQNKDDIVVPKDYANVEQKKAQLFFQTPDIQLEPKLPGLEPVVPVFEAVLNHLLGAHGVNAMAMVTEVLSDALCPSGVFASKIAYEIVVDGMKPIPGDPTPQPDGTQMPGPPQSVPNIISEKYTWERIDPLKLLIPAEFAGSDYDRAAYLGFGFVMDWPRAQRAFSLPDDFSAFIDTDDRILGKENTVGGADASGTRTSSKRVKGWEIWYRAAAFDAKEKHPDKTRLLVLIDGCDEAVRHEDSPFQRIGPDGQVIGMKGFPVHVGALRFVSGTALPPSDVQMSRFQVRELSEGRTQMIQQRKRSIPMRFADLGRIGGVDGLAKIEKNIYQGIIPLESGQKSDPPLWDMERSAYPRENFEFDEVANRDLAQAWALDNNQTGVQTPSARTATESSLIQQNTNIRMDAERTKFLAYYVSGVEKLAALVQLFADDASYVRIVGSDGNAQLQPWDKTTIAGEFVFKARPNSSLRVDAATERSQFLQVYNLLAPNPFISQQELITQLVRKFDLDPTKLIAPPQPKPAEVPKFSFTFNDQSLNPANPAFPIVLEILRQGGVVISDQAIQESQNATVNQGAPPQMVAGAVSHGDAPLPSPGGQPMPSAQASSPINKHQTERTGQQPGPKITAGPR